MNAGPIPCSGMTQMGFLVGVLIMVLSHGCAIRPIMDASRGEVGFLHLQATRTEAYCKGVAPRPEDYPTAQPWSGVQYIRKADDVDAKGHAMNDVKRAPLDSIRTDGTGHGSIPLAPGHYILLDADRATDRRYHQLLRDHAQATPHRSAIDKACLDDWLRGPFPVFTITAGDTARVDQHSRGTCSWDSVPCAPWHGPLPP